MKTKKSYSTLLDIREEIYNELARLPKGTIKERLIYGKKYFYLQRREGKKVVHQYIGKEVPAELKKQMQRRKDLKGRLAQTHDSLMGYWVKQIKSL